MTIEQLRTASAAGGIVGVTLRGRGGGFLVEIATRNGDNALLAKARSVTPRRFGNPMAALSVLRDIGITVGRFDATDWNPDEKVPLPAHRGRAEALRRAHEAAAYTAWVTQEIEAALADPRPSLTQAEVMAELAMELASKPPRAPGR